MFCAVVLELDPGLGGFVELARRVGPQGRVYAVDIDDGVIAFIRHWGAHVPEGKRIVPVLSRPEDLTLDPDLLDMAVIHGDGFLSGHGDGDGCNSTAGGLLASIFRSLRSGGRLVVNTVVNTATLAGCAVSKGFEKQLMVPTAEPPGSARDHATYWLVLAKP